MQGVIAEYERAKIAERYRRGKLYRARQGEIPFWKTSYAHRRVVPADGGPARIEVFEPEAEIVRWIFDAYVEKGRSVRQISFDLLDRGIPSPTGKPIWGTSTITRLLRNEAYIGTVYYNRREHYEGNGRRGARNRKTRSRERPREEWIPIPVPAIVDRDTFARVKQVSRDNSKWNPRGAEWGVWLLRGLIECGHCHLGCNCHRMRGRNGTWHRYYYCRGHDPLRTRAGMGRCPERNIRADELDEYVFAQVRQALLDPRQLIAAERAVIAGAPANENELVAAQLKRLDSALQTNERERARLIDAYQAGLLELDELTSRTAAITARRDQLTQEKDILTSRSAELATENRLRRRLAGFAEQIVASLDDLDTEGRRRLLRLVVEKVRVTGWRVEIHLKIPLPDDPPDDDPPHPAPSRTTDRQAICACVPLVARISAWWMSRSIIAVAAMSSPKISPHAEDGLLAGHDHRARLVAAETSLNMRLGGFGVKRDVADLVDDDSGIGTDQRARASVVEVARRLASRSRATHSGGVPRTGRAGRPGTRGPSASIARWRLAGARASSGRTTHVVEFLPERVRLIAAPGELRDVELEVLGWSTDDFSGETVLLCRLLDGSSGEIPARWTDLPWRVAPELAVGGIGSPAGWRLLLARAERLRRPRRGRASGENGGDRVGTARVGGARRRRSCRRRCGRRCRPSASCRSRSGSRVCSPGWSRRRAMSDLQKITEQHRHRRAIVYVRQSTPTQLERNHESRARQYALRQRAIELGWPAASVSVVDEDLGRSGASS